MKKLIIGALFALVIFISLIPLTASAAGDVEINATNFPDANFRSIISEYFDIDCNGALNSDEINQVTFLNIFNCNIISLKGIEFFSDLDYLNCSDNQLIKLDLSNNTKLTYLDCYFNQLTELNVSKNTELTYLDCSANQLTKININNNTELTDLYLSNNNVYSLDLSKNVNLSVLCYCRNPLICIDVSNTLIDNLDCSNNYSIYTDNNTFDLNNLPPYFDINKVISWGDCFVSGSILNINFVPAIVFTYDCGRGIINKFYIDVFHKIDSTSFPDPVFREYISLKFDINNDGYLQYSETYDEYNTITINVDNMNILSLKGIEYFRNLYSLSCSNNFLTSLDLSFNKNLYFLYCDNNQLSSLDVSNNKLMQWVQSDYNEYSICIDSNLRFDLNTLPIGFDVNKTSNWVGCTVSENILTLDNPRSVVTFTYDCGNGFTETFCLYIPVEINTTNFPDAFFRNYISKYDKNKNNILTGYEMLEVKKIYIYSNNLTSINLKGAEIFPYLTCLECYSNQLTELDISYCLSLTYLNCSGNQLTKLDVSQNTALTKLICYSNQLTELDVSNNTALTYLYCSYNQLTDLDVSNNTALTELYCHYNQLTDLDVSNNTALTHLRCYSNQLTDLDVSNNTALTELHCYYNQLTDLDVSNNTALTYLYCSDNQLTDLDVSNNTALTHLHCYYNQLTDLDVSNNTALTDLYCYSNQLTDLDVSNNTALTYLNCSINQMTDLDVSNNTALTDLYCYYNQLTDLDVSNNTALTYLYCIGNQLTKLDVSNNTALTKLTCYSNQLTELDVSNNTALTYLYCSGNQLTELDVSKNTALTHLHCDNNQLTDLDVSKNTALTHLHCDNNQLTDLDVSNNTALTELYCYYNQLTDLDVSTCSALTFLDCFYNQLTDLDVSNCSALRSLKCYNNQLTSLDISKNTKLSTISVGSQRSSITLSTNYTLDLTSLPGNFVPGRASAWTNCTVSGNTLTMTKCAPTITYSYNCGQNKTMYVTLDVSNAPHTYGTHNVTQPTCTEMGYTSHICSSCGFVKTDTYTSQTGHLLNENLICRMCGEQFDAPLRYYTVYVCDAETHKPLEGAEVIFGNKTMTADVNGKVVWLLEDDSPAFFRVSSGKYPAFEVSSYTPDSHNEDYIYLASTESDIYSAYCNGKNVLTGSAQINTHSHLQKAYITVSGRAMANITKYALVQDSVVIAESVDGNFEIRNVIFKNNVDVYVRMYTDGASGHNIFERKVNIKVVKASLNVETDLKGLLPFDTGLRLTFPGGTPVFGGLTITIPQVFSNTSYFSTTITNNKIVILFGSEKDFESQNDLENMTSAEIFKKLKKDYFKKQFKTSKREVYGNLAIILEFDEIGITKTYGEIQVGFNLGFGAGKTFMVSVIPVYVEFRADLNGEVVISNIGYDNQNATILVPTGLATLKGAVTIYGGFGCNVASAGIYGSLGMEVIFDSTESVGFHRLSLFGELGMYVKLKIFFFKEICYKYPMVHGQFTWPEYASSTGFALYSLDEYSDSPRQYLTDRTEWLSGQSTYGLSTEYQMLQGSAYDSIEPRILPCGDTFMMVFTDDDGSDGLNYQHLFFSIYDKETDTWSTPARVDENENSDVEFDIYSDNGKVYIVYTEIGTVTDTNADEAILAGAEVIAAYFDPALGKFTGHTNISKNDSFDTLPQISVTPEGPVAVWVNNFTNDIFTQNANNVLMLSVFANGEWSAPTALTERGSTVISMDLGTLCGRAYAALIRDIDCDLSTVDDRVLVLIGTDGSVITINSDRDGKNGVQFATVGSENRLFWFNGSDYCSVSDSLVTEILSDSEGLSEKFRIVSISDSEYVILFTMNEAPFDEDGNTLGGSNIYGMFFSDGKLGQPIKITENDIGLYIDSFDAAFTDGKLIIPYIRSLTTITDDNIYKSVDFMSACLELSENISVGTPEYDTDTLLGRGSVEIMIPIINNSRQDISELDFAVLDRLGNTVLTGTRSPEAPIGSGSTGYISVILDKSMLTVGENYTINVLSRTINDSEPSDNTVSLALWYTDFTVDTDQLLIAGENKIRFFVTNEGNIAGNAIVKIYKLEEDSSETVLDTYSITDLGAGASLTGTFSVNDAYYGTIYVSVVPENEEIYSFNDSVCMTVNKLTDNPTVEVTVPAVPVNNPSVSKSHIEYDKASGGDISLSISEESFSFAGIEGLNSEAYIFSAQTLTLRSEYLQTLGKGINALTLKFTSESKQTELTVIIEVSDTSFTEVEIYAPDQAVKYDGMQVGLADEIIYSTISEGSISAEFSTDNGATWISGMPTEIGVYTVKLTVGADEENRYLPAECIFTLTIEIGTRAISVPYVLSSSPSGIVFGNSLPTAGENDGTVLYGFSTTNDPSGISEWNTSGTVTDIKADTVYYLFSKISGGEKYDDAYSLGFPVSMHIYDKEIVSDYYLVSPATCVASAVYYKSCICGEKTNETFVYGEPNKDAHCGKYLYTVSETTHDITCDACKNSIASGESHDFLNGLCRCGAELDLVVNTRGNIAYTVDGKTLTLKGDLICKVGYLENGNYVAISPNKNSDGTYVFNAPKNVTEVLIVIKGDVNGDGRIRTNDASMAKAIYLGKDSITPTAEQIFAADANGDGRVRTNDASMIKSVYLGKKTFDW